MTIVAYRHWFFAGVAAITLGAIGSIVYFGLPLSVDFTGGSLVEVSYPDGRPELNRIQESVERVIVGDAQIRESGEANIIIKTQSLTPEGHQALFTALSLDGTAPVTETRFNTVGPALGAELATKALWALALVLLTIVLYVAWAFRKVSHPVSSFFYGLVVILVLLHDIIVPAGVYALLAHVGGAQVDALFVVALLAILGYSVNDTIVIFDRVREHLKQNQEQKREEPFEITVGKSVNETMTRSINTSLTTALALIALAVFGSEVTLWFALLLLAGVVAGTYSSIVVAAPLLIPLAKWFPKKQNEEQKRP